MTGAPIRAASARAKVDFPVEVLPPTTTRRMGGNDRVRKPVKLHEFQAKQVLARAGIGIPEGRIATTPAEAEAAATALGPPVVVKAQVHVGGRGKAGGVKLAKTAAEARAAAQAILGMDIK